MDINAEVFQRLTEKLSLTTEEITFNDDRGDGRHFSLKIVSPLFEGKTRIARSRMIYAVLDDLIKKDHIHALQMTLKTPQELQQ